MKNRQPIIESPINEPFTDKMRWYRSEAHYGIEHFRVDDMPLDRAKDLLLEVIMKVKRIKGAHQVDEILTTVRVIAKLRRLASLASSVPEDRLLFLKSDDNGHKKLCGIPVKVLRDRDEIKKARGWYDRYSDKIIIELV